MIQFTYHHVGIAVPNILIAIEKYQALFGYALTSGPYDDPIQNVTVCFLSKGGIDPVLELVAPLGPSSPVEGILKRGGGMYHLCYEVTNLEAAILHLTRQGSLLLSRPVPAVAFDGRHIAWLLTDVNLLVELIASG